jgi:hypothetical protein
MGMDRIMLGTLALLPLEILLTKPEVTSLLPKCDIDIGWR